MKLAPIIAIALLIILPMALILTSYSNSQLKTIQYQVSYDAKLRNSTCDAIKAFQLNMSNSMTSDMANSKIRDIEASVNVFYTSLVNNFSTNGYSKEGLRNYIPAIVYTLYDGYYIYSVYDNKLANIDLIPGTQYSAGEIYEDEETHEQRERIYGLKPYIYYSCRYKPKDNCDFVITYSLDSYITIKGIVDGKPINVSGYLLTDVNKVGDKYTYNGIEIQQEDGDNLKENVYVEDYNDQTINEHLEGESINASHIKYNGVKYYENKNKTEKYPYDIFSMLNDDRIDTKSVPVTLNDIKENKQGIKYYEEAYKFKQFILGEGEIDGFKGRTHSLNELTSDDAVDINGKKYENDGPYTKGINIFEELYNLGYLNEKSIEDKDSNFYLHRTEVIKNAIESNLMVAIDNFNKVSTSSVQFAMPKLTDSDWEKLTNGISMISFLQGLNIGGKIYNGYSIVLNDINDDFVGENAIYIVADGKYYLPTDETLKNLDLSNAIGVLNSNFELRTVNDTETDVTGKEIQESKNYYPRSELASYTSIVNPGSLANNTEKTIYELMKEYASSANNTEKEIAKIYFTALGRERQSMYKIN